jgi:hypothetical protein
LLSSASSGAVHCLGLTDIRSPADFCSNLVNESCILAVAAAAVCHVVRLELAARSGAMVDAEAVQQTMSTPTGAEVRCIQNSTTDACRHPTRRPCLIVTTFSLQSPQPLFHHPPSTKSDAPDVRPDTDCVSWHHPDRLPRATLAARQGGCHGVPEGE